MSWQPDLDFLPYILAVLFGAVAAYVSLFPLIRLRRRYCAKRIVSRGPEASVPVLLIALTFPFVRYLEINLLGDEGLQHSTFAIAAVLCWLYAMRFLARFVIRPPAERLIFQAVVMPAVFGAALLTAHLTLQAMTPGMHSVPDCQWSIPPTLTIFSLSLTYWVSRAVAPPDRPDARAINPVRWLTQVAEVPGEESDGPATF